MREICNGDGCDVVFTVRRRPGMSETEFAAEVERAAPHAHGALTPTSLPSSATNDAAAAMHRCSPITS